MLPHAGIKAFFTAIHVNKWKDSTELLCVLCFTSFTYSQKIVQNAFHNDFCLKKKEYKGARKGHKGLLQLNTKYLTQNYQQDKLLPKKRIFSDKLVTSRECDYTFSSSLYELF